MNFVFRGPWRGPGGVSRRHFAAESRCRSRVKPCEICGQQSGSGNTCSWYFGFPPSFRQCYILVVHDTVSIRGRWRNWEPFKQIGVTSDIEAHWTYFVVL